MGHLFEKKMRSVLGYNLRRQGKDFLDRKKNDSTSMIEYLFGEVRGCCQTEGCD